MDRGEPDQHRSLQRTDGRDLDQSRQGKRFVDQRRREFNCAYRQSHAAPIGGDLEASGREGPERLRMTADIGACSRVGVVESTAVSDFNESETALGGGVGVNAVRCLWRRERNLRRDVEMPCADANWR